MNPFKAKETKIVTNYIPKERVSLNQIQDKLHPNIINGKTPDKKKIDSLKRNNFKWK